MNVRHLSPFLSCLAPIALAAAAAGQDAMPNFGHARARELAELGKLPGAMDVVVRDLVNYHRHRLPLPTANHDVALDVRCDRATAGVGDEVWLQVGYTTAPQGDRSLARPSAVALVVDVSGSMADAGKLTAVQSGLRAFVDRLRADDEVALVTFSTEAELVQRRRPRGDGRWLHAAIDRLTPGGNTNLHAGLMLGLDELSRGDLGERHRRVIVLTDGIANRGVTAPEQIVADTTRRAEATIDISTIGVGQNLDVPLLQRLAAGCRGLFHFVADGADVQKVFVQEADALLAAVARRVRLEIELPDGLALERVYHEGVTFHGNRLTMTLPDLNAGVTGVVLVRCRLVRDPLEAMSAPVDLAFDSVATQRPVRMRAYGLLGDSHAASAKNAIDLEVRKNAAIAVLSQGLADMAKACDQSRWADADRALQRASDEAQRLFPGEDADVQRVRDIAAGHDKTLRRYVERFRDR